jgi:hypothetical protein
MQTLQELVGYSPKGKSLSFWMLEEALAYVSLEYLKLLVCSFATQDLITYRVEGTRPLKLVECVRGDGDLCGAIFLDQAFHKKVKSWVSKDKWKTIDEHRKNQLADDWERLLKRDFTGYDDDHDWTIPIPEDWRAKSQTKKKPRGFRERFGFKKSAIDVSYHESSHMKITTEDIKQIFQPVMTDIERLVKDQIAKAYAKEGQQPTAILLAGGFGSNKYLFEYLSTKFGPSIEIVQRPFPEP